jgi:hypothetical protein
MQVLIAQLPWVVLHFDPGRSGDNLALLRVAAAQKSQTRDFAQIKAPRPAVLALEA